MGREQSVDLCVCAAGCITRCCFRKRGFERLREKSVELTGYFEFLLDRLGAAVQLITPRDPNARGCQLSFRITGAGRGA